MLTKQSIVNLIKEKGSVTGKDISDQFSVSRTYVNKLVKELREDGMIVLVGKTNNAKYVLASDETRAKKFIRSITLHLKNLDLHEDLIFKRIEKETGIFINIEDSVYRILQYSFTEMLNNAIDHSHSAEIIVTCRRSDSAINFAVRDYGIGIFNNVQEKFRLAGTMAAIQEILKGKTTTAPTEHSGQGIFFTSKMADVFVIDSFDKRLTVNNLLPDIFITDRKSLKGTRISFTIQIGSKRSIKSIFDNYSGGEEDDYEFNRTRITVKLYQFGDNLLSRSEAKRVTVNLENFKEVELDFSDVHSIGQAFADEIFRVWQNRHPDIKLIPTNTDENVDFMIRRVL